MEISVQDSAAAVTSGGGMTTQGMKTINPDDLAEDEVNIYVIAIPYATPVALPIWRVVVYI